MFCVQDSSAPNILAAQTSVDEDATEVTINKAHDATVSPYAASVEGVNGNTGRSKAQLRQHAKTAGVGKFILILVQAIRLTSCVFCLQQLGSLGDSVLGPLFVLQLVAVHRDLPPAPRLRHQGVR